MLCPLLRNRALRTHLLILLDKNEQEDAGAEPRKQMPHWAGQVKRDSGG